MTSEHRVAGRVDAAHPSLPGHFPGQPIVPGVLLLDRVLAAAQAQFGPLRLVGIPAVKFLQPLLPEQPYEIVLERSGPAQLRFRCEAGGRLLLQGSLAVADGAA